MLGKPYNKNRQIERAATLLAHVARIDAKTLALDGSMRSASPQELAKALTGMGDGYHGKAAELLEHFVRVHAKTLAPDDPRRLASQQELEEANRLIEAERRAKSCSRQAASPAQSQ